MHIVFTYMLVSMIVYLSPVTIPDGRKVFKNAYKMFNGKHFGLQFIVSGLLVGWAIGLIVWLIIFLGRD